MKAIHSSQAVRRFAFAVFWVAILGVLFPFPAWTSVEGPPIVLAPGEQRLIPTVGLERYSLGSDVVRALPPKDGDHLLVKGVKPGRSDLWFWKKDGSAEHRVIRVDPIPAEVSPPLLQGLSQLNETEVFFAGNTATLRGTVRTAREMATIQSLVSAFAKEIRDETELSENLLNAGHQTLQDWLRNSAFSGRLRLDRMEGQLYLTGSVEKPMDEAAVIKKAKSLFPAVHVRIEVLPDDSPTVHFKVFLLELKRNRFGSFGLRWPSGQEGAFRVSSAGVESFLQLDIALQTLEGDGSLKVLSNPELVVRAPGEAELFSGGELPIHAKSQYYSSVTWKNFGLGLKLKVTHKAGDRVRLDISTEVSELDPTITGNDIPGIQANRMKTQVDARFGVPLFLSGLLQSSTRKHARGLPALRSLPILGALFGSEDYLNEKSELVAILLPSAAPPPPTPITMKRVELARTSVQERPEQPPIIRASEIERVDLHDWKGGYE